MTVDQLASRLAQLVRDDPGFARARVVLSVSRSREVPARYVEGFIDATTRELRLELS